MFTHDGPLVGQGPHVRRKSVLPGTYFLDSCLDPTELSLHFGGTVDPAVLRDLQAHKSLDVNDGSRGADMS